MPDPKEYDSEKDWMAACVPMRIGEGDEQEQAVAVCMNIWRNKDAEKSTAIKAVGDWELEVRGVPYGSPDNRDSDGEYFSQRTKLHTDRFPTPLVQYYHGLNPDGKPDGDPEIIGEVKSIENRPDGVWYRVLLNKASEYAKRVWDGAKQGIARASSGSIAHLWRKNDDGEIINWPVVELALFDAIGSRQPANKFAVALPVMQKSYKTAGIELPDLDEPETEAEDAQAQRAEVEPSSAPEESTNLKTLENIDMEKNEILEVVADALKADREATAKLAEVEKAEKERVEAAVKSARDEWEKEAAKSNRLPTGGGAPFIAKYNDMAYNNLDAGDQALLVGVLQSAGKKVSETAVKSLAAKLEEDKSGVGEMGRQAMKMAGVKANEIDYATQQYYGDEWVGVAYSQSIWEAIRVGTFVVPKLPSIEVPQGMESIYLPLESTDPIFYKVAEATAIEATYLKNPAATVSNSPLGTARQQLTLAKMGARVIWTGEMEEDSLVPFVSQLRAQLTKAGSEYLESAVIDGDTSADATNINETSTGAAGTEWFTVFDGLRHLPLITNTDNKRAGGALTVEDYLETVKLLGAAGINALDRSKVSFIVDPNTYYKTMALPEVLTRDVFSSPQLEGGQLRGLWGYDMAVSGSMHKNSSVRKTNSSGEVDEITATNNLYGAILAVRWDQWKFGWRRRMTLETTRIANADSTEIVAMMRVGLIYRDTDASALTYGVIV